MEGFTTKPKTNATIADLMEKKFLWTIRTVLLDEYGYKPFTVREAHYILCGMPEFRRRLKGSRHLQSIIKYCDYFEAIEKPNKGKVYKGNSSKMFAIRRDLNG